jgi:hypothetical protein
VNPVKKIYSVEKKTKDKKRKKEEEKINNGLGPLACPYFFITYYPSFIFF